LQLDCGWDEAAEGMPPPGGSCLSVFCVGPLWGPPLSVCVLCGSPVGPSPPVVGFLRVPPPVLTDSLRAAHCSSFHASASPCGPILAMVPRSVHAAGGGLRALSTATLAEARRSSGPAAAEIVSAAPRDCLEAGATGRDGNSAEAGATGRDGKRGIRASAAPPDSWAGAPTGQRATYDSFTKISDTQSAELTDWAQPTRRRAAVRHKINAPRLAAIEFEAFDAADVDVKTSRSRAASKSHKRAALKIVAISDAEYDCRAAVPALKRAQHAWKELRTEDAPPLAALQAFNAAFAHAKVAACAAAAAVHAIVADTFTLRNFPPGLRHARRLSAEMAPIEAAAAAVLPAVNTVRAAPAPGAAAYPADIAGGGGAVRSLAARAGARLRCLLAHC